MYEYHFVLLNLEGSPVRRGSSTRRELNKSKEIEITHFCVIPRSMGEVCQSSLDLLDALSFHPLKWAMIWRGRNRVLSTCSTASSADKGYSTSSSGVTPGPSSCASVQLCLWSRSLPWGQALPVGSDPTVKGNESPSPYSR